jgi:uncharacterized membrane protein YbhN (UPF0104 family)
VDFRRSTSPLSLGSRSENERNGFITDRRRRWLPWVGGLIGIAALALLLRRFDLDRFVAILAGANTGFLVLVPLAIMGEQLVRAWKWRQLLRPLRSVGTFVLFGTIMAGYLLSMLVPFGFGTIARSWLVARREDLKMSAVLATVAIDRLTDGIVFACLVPVALLVVVFPDPTGDIHTGLIWGAAGSLLLFIQLLSALVGYKRNTLHIDGLLLRLVDRLPPRVASPLRRVCVSFAEGIAWPHERWRGAGIMLASVAIKLIAATHFLWAGLALGVALQPGQYLFLLVFLGFLVILGHFARVAGTFVLGAVFALALLGIGEERALAMVLIVMAANLLSVAGIGAFALWRQGVALADLRTAGVADAAG